MCVCYSTVNLILSGGQTLNAVVILFFMQDRRAAHNSRSSKHDTAVSASFGTSSTTLEQRYEPKTKGPSH